MAKKPLSLGLASLRASVRSSFFLCLLLILTALDTVGEDTPEEVDEKIFMLRPYVFACAKVGSSDTRPPKNLCLCSTTEQNPDSTTCRSPLGISKNSPSAILAALPTTLTLLSVTEL